MNSVGENDCDDPSMADWSELPMELLNLISERLDSPLYHVRFRSVCSSWRSISSPTSNPNYLPFHFPILSHHPLFHHHATTFSLSKRSLFLVTPPQSLQPSWFIKISQDKRGRTLIYHPLSRLPIKAHRFNHPIDFYHLNVIDFGHEIVHSDASMSDSLYMEKVVLLTIPDSRKDRFALLTIHVSGKLALFRSGDEGWTVFPFTPSPSPSPYDDVCVFKGKLCAVDNTGRAVTVQFDQLDSNVGLLAEPVFGGDKKFLVESQGELLLVDKYFTSDLSGYEDVDDFIINDDEFGWERAVRFDVFRLDEERKRWVEVRSLGDRILFLGDDCAFSASVTDLRVGEGNCVIFREDCFGLKYIQSAMAVFHLDEGRISPLSDYPGYSELFWPPPDWVWLR